MSDQQKLSDEERAEEARRWSPDRPIEPGWVEAPQAVPRAGNSEPISLRLPRQQLAIIREFARRQGIGYQVLIKRWLDERIALERDRRELAEPVAVPASLDNLIAALAGTVRQIVREELALAVPTPPAEVGNRS